MSSQERPLVFHNTTSGGRMRGLGTQLGPERKLRVGANDRERIRTTVGCAGNVVHASALALIDSYEWVTGHAGPLASPSPAAGVAS